MKTQQIGSNKDTSTTRVDAVVVGAGLAGLYVIPPQK